MLGLAQLQTLTFSSNHHTAFRISMQVRVGVYLFKVPGAASLPAVTAK